MVKDSTSNVNGVSSDARMGVGTSSNESSPMNFIMSSGDAGRNAARTSCPSALSNHSEPLMRSGAASRAVTITSRSTMSRPPGRRIVAVSPDRYW